MPLTCLDKHALNYLRLLYFRAINL